MFQAPAPVPVGFAEPPASQFDLARVRRIAKARLLHFAIPYLLALLVGSVVIALLKPIYRSEGTILVESPEISAVLVHPTITEVADQRIQVIQQRLMARDNLTALISKYKLFGVAPDTTPTLELINLVRSRTSIKPVEGNAASPSSSTIAFTLSFDYENPKTAMDVADEFLTSILHEDATARKRDAASTTEFLQQDVRRIEVEHDAVLAQLADLQKKLTKARVEKHSSGIQEASTELVQKRKSLADLEIDLAKKSSVYGAEHPVILELKRDIAALKSDIAKIPAPPPALPEETESEPAPAPGVLPATASGFGSNLDAFDLLRRETELRKKLEDANAKLTTAQLGEAMERNQQGERLQVIEQPTLPRIPVWPKKYVWLGGVFAFAFVAGAASVVLSEVLDASVRSGDDLAGLVDRSMLVNLPYLASDKEKRWERRRIVFACLVMAAVSVAAFGVAALKGSATAAALLNAS